MPSTKERQRQLDAERLPRCIRYLRLSQTPTQAYQWAASESFIAPIRIWRKAEVTLKRATKEAEKGERHGK